MAIVCVGLFAGEQQVMVDFTCWMLVVFGGSLEGQQQRKSSVGRGARHPRHRHNIVWWRSIMDFTTTLNPQSGSITAWLHIVTMGC